MSNFMGDTFIEDWLYIEGGAFKVYLKILKMKRMIDEGNGKFSKHKWNGVQ